jgi:NADH-quinone oxidoreductase subunit A
VVAIERIVATASGHSDPPSGAFRNPALVTAVTRVVEPFSSSLVALANVLTSGSLTAGRMRVLDSWLPFLIYGFFALAIPLSMMFASFALATRPGRRMRAKTLPFESGVSQGPTESNRFTISFYLTAMLFIVFDIEIVFLYPLAVILHQLAWFGFVEFLFFIAILALAYVYIWRKGALEWR